MTGSPVFKVNFNSSKKQKIQRKLNFVRDVPKNQRLLHVDNLQPDSCEAKAKTHDLNKHGKSISSSLSSFVFPNKKGVKRKLDFDVDDASDDMSSFRFSSRNISLCGLQSKNSSLVDAKSITYSPNKNRFRSSYTKSSVTSTCRRRLFADCAPDPKKAKLESPVLGSNSNSKKKEIKLSLKKKFPGVPNSDAARSGLLLNLAFSKYNLSSNNKDEKMSLGFVDDSAVTTATKKDFVHYSSIKKDNSNCHSPVFMAIKKVKRKLNLEDQDMRCSTNIESQVETSVVDKDDVCNVPQNTSVEESEQKKQHCETVENEQIDITDVEKNLSMTVLSEQNSHATPNANLPHEKKPVQELLPSSSPIFMKGHQGTQKQRNDLFRNSKLRSSLRNRIFNLSKCPTDIAKDVSASSAPLSPTVDKKNCQHEHRRHSQDFKRIFDNPKSKPAPRYDRIIVKRNLVGGTERDSERLKGLAGGTSGKSELRKKPQKWINDSFYKDKAKRCQKGKSSFDNRLSGFIASHMQRFLRDCLNAVEQGIEANEILDTSSADGKSESTALASLENKVEPGGNENDVCEREELSTRIADPVEYSDCPMENSVGQALMIETSNREDESKRLESVSEMIKSPASFQQPEGDFAFESSQSAKESIVQGTSNFIIEDPNSQEISNQCVEEVELVIENPNSEDSFFEDDDCGIDRALLGRNKRFHIFEDTVDEDDLTKISDVKVMLFDNSSEVDVQNYKVEEISTPGSMYNGNQYLEVHDLDSIPAKTVSLVEQDEICDSVKKRKRKKINSGTLMARLTKLLNRERSEAHMWEYELSKRNNFLCSEDRQKPAVFRVDKMWKEFSHLFLLCSFVNQDTPDELYDLDDVKNFGIRVSNSVIIIMEPEFCPKSLTYSTLFQVHPPWRISYSMKSDPLILVRPYKIDIVSETGNPIYYKDPTLPNSLRVMKETLYCTCRDVSCECVLPEGYQTVIQPLLLPNPFGSLDWNNYSRLRNYNAEDFNSTDRIIDVILKHKLYPTECLHLDLRILHVHRNRVRGGEFTFYHIICINEKREVCCVVVEGEMKTNSSLMNAEVTFRFFGILPWKLIPTQSVPSFLEHVELTDVSNILQKIGDTGVFVFVLSQKYSDIKRLI